MIDNEDASGRPAKPGKLAWIIRLRDEPPFPMGKLLGAGALGLVFVVWTLATLGDVPEVRFVSPTILPSPTEVFGSLGSLITERQLAQSITATLRRLFLGFGLAILVGVPAGIFAGSFRAFEAFMAPMMLFGRNVPIAALIPLTIVWFGIGEAQKVLFIFIATLPFVLTDAAKSVISVNQRYVETAQTLGATQWQIIRKILVPLAVPDMYTNLRHLFGLAFGYIMLAELINAEHGLGFLLSNSQRRGLSEHIFLILILIGLLAYVIDRTLLWLQRGLFPYRRDL